MANSAPGGGANDKANPRIKAEEGTQTFTVLAEERDGNVVITMTGHP